jgi:hypothetical protein
MFDLEQAVADWRQQMAESGLRQPELLDELESHLRDAFESQVRSGLGPQQAFDAAIQSVGQANLLKHEFAKSLTAFDRFKHVVLTFAGIPNHNLATNMNTSHTEPAWATYLKAAAFLLPAIFLATLSAIWVVPKLQQICVVAGVPEATAGTFWNLTQSSIRTMLLFSEHGHLIAGGIILLLILLEWRSTQWPRYRRATVSFGAFVVNTFVLIALFMMFMAAILAAPGMAHAVR